ncbi:DUF134 domain-containing protein [Chloroflexota bacterium]
MPRPAKCRRVACIPGINYFKPAGIPLRNMEVVTLSVEEAETVRLKDLIGLDQKDCAAKMHISRQTFQRELVSARKKIADALLNGKAIRIEGGNFEMAIRRFRCVAGHEWETPFETMIANPPKFCPKCYTPNIISPFPHGMGQRGHMEEQPPK